MLHEKLMGLALTGGEWVLWLLIAISVLCLGVALERAIFGTLNRSPESALQAAMEAYFKSADRRLGAQELLRALETMRGAEARVLASGLRASLDGGNDSAEEALVGTLTFERLKMERGLIVLGTTGSNAPFVGLFGTVLGIIKAFNELARDMGEASTSVMAGISEALLATAVGLAVAIPAVILYNYFMRRNKDTLARLESLAHLMLSRVKGTPQTATTAEA